MNKLQKYSDLKVGDIVYIKPNYSSNHLLNYHNTDRINIRDWSILARVEEINKDNKYNEIYNVIVTPISSNFGLILQYPIQITNADSSIYYTRPKDITVLSD